MKEVFYPQACTTVFQCVIVIFSSTDVLLYIYVYSTRLFYSKHALGPISRYKEIPIRKCYPM